MDASLSCFLFDPARREHQCRHGLWTYRFLKSKYGEETDLLYYLEAHGEGELHRIGADATHAGIISYSRNQFYFSGSCAILAIDCSAKLSDVLSRAEADIAEKIRTIVNDEPVPVSPEARAVYQAEEDKECWLVYEADQEVRSAFDSGLAPTYQPRYRLGTPSTALAVRLINHYDDTVAQTAAAYVRVEARHINQRLWKLDIIKSRLALLKQMRNDDHSHPILSSAHDLMEEV